MIGGEPVIEIEKKLHKYIHSLHVITPLPGKAVAMGRRLRRIISVGCITLKATYSGALCNVAMPHKESTIVTAKATLV